MTIKVYTIVTNDELELPVQFGLVGAKAVADYLGKSVSCVRKNLMSGKWSNSDKYKAVYDEYGTETHLRELKKRAKQRAFMQDRSQYFREYQEKRRCNA